MKLSDHKILKKEILDLPGKEKDKLLLRLISKDKILTEHLHYILLEDESNLKDRIEGIKGHILKVTEELNSHGKMNAKESLASLRKLFKSVNHNLRITKALFEDVELRIFLFTQISPTFKYKFFGTHKDYEQAFYTYFLKAILVTLNKFYKLHEDLQFDLKENFNVLLERIYAGKMADEAVHNGIPKRL